MKPIKTGLVVAHSSSRPAQGVGGCLLPIPWPFGDTPHNPLPEVSGERPFWIVKFSLMAHYVYTYIRVRTS